MPPVEDAPGYRVLDQAGQGGFAVVYRAYQERLDRVVALKVLSVDRVDQRTMRRFQRELQLTGRLTGHPNVVTVFDTGVTASGKPYIAMDFFENGSLRDKVRKEGPLPLPEVLRAGVKLAGALAAVHEAGVLHGDIKPQNILISRYGEPAIADFGVARVVDSAEISATSQAFTPLHAAPEVLTGHPHSRAGDIYSLGSTLYHLLAGQPAFHNPADPSIAPLMYRVLSLDPPPINRADVPQAALDSILRAMAKQPELRYGSAREFAQRLRAVQAELGLSVTDLVGQDPGPGPAMSTVPRARQETAAAPAAPTSPPRSRRGLVVGASVAALAVAGAAVALFLSSRRPESGPPTPVATGSTPAPTIGKRDIVALTPGRPRLAADRGALVELRWTLPARAKRYPLVLQRSPVEQGGQPLTPLPAGATSARVAGLDPAAGYCFLVGVPLSIAESSTVAWSRPLCIRGAVAGEQ
ncbi:serine/threonine protein kinase [Nonomuraea sp. NN258]|uniref:serine/threonine-protein kinase n=1 Tax=Nonomuraea antri TaxID=2730852 RepID=UPI00156850A7|nr:serine/threonine-protein kinase [Nonomuraea antri]NRQ38375.1 serine/threonine protein kinase [Nonomuraea antri]